MGHDNQAPLQPKAVWLKNTGKNTWTTFSANEIKIQQVSKISVSSILIFIIFIYLFSFTVHNHQPRVVHFINNFDKSPSLCCEELLHSYCWPFNKKQRWFKKNDSMSIRKNQLFDWYITVYIGIIWTHDIEYIMAVCYVLHCMFVAYFFWLTNFAWSGWASIHK